MKTASGQYDFEVKWLPFFLDATIPSEGVDKIERYKSKFGSRTESIMQNMKQVGNKEGINFSYGGKIANTLNAHRLISFGEKFGKQDEVVNALFTSYCEEERNLGDISVLLDAAKIAGLKEQETKDFLESDEGKSEVRSKVNQVASQYGVTGVPFFIFNEKFSFSGAQEPNAFLDAFQKVAK